MNSPGRTFAILAFAVSMLLGCAEKIVAPPVTWTTLLTAKPWVTRKYTVDNVDRTFSPFAPQKTTFNTDSTYVTTMYDATVKNGTWEFNVAETTLVQDKGLVNEYDWSIRILNDSTLKLRATATVGGQPYITEYEAYTE